LQPSVPPGKCENFDGMTKYVISGKEFKSWNNDPAFTNNGLNAFYFKYEKLHKVEIEFIGSPVGIIDIVSWDARHPQYELRPLVLHLAPRGNYHMKFQFYANPLYLNRKVGFFEPRVHSGWHGIKDVRVSKLLTLKSTKECEYTLFFLKRAYDFLYLAKGEFDAADYGLAFHFSRFVIEFSLKSMYTVFGLTYDKEHGVEFSKELRQKILKILPKFPLPKLLWICKQHASPPRVDLYGDELGFAPSYSFIGENEAGTAIKNAIYCYDYSTSLLDHVQKA
jgi:hypothetical protein